MKDQLIILNPFIQAEEAKARFLNEIRLFYERSKLNNSNSDYDRANQLAKISNSIFKNNRLEYLDENNYGGDQSQLL